MVKIQQRTARKPYMRGKRVYQYDRRSITIPKEFHAITDVFLNLELTETARVQDGSLIITLTPENE